MFFLPTKQQRGATFIMHSTSRHCWRGNLRFEIYGGGGGGCLEEQVGFSSDPIPPTYIGSLHLPPPQVYRLFKPVTLEKSSTNRRRSYKKEAAKREKKKKTGRRNLAWNQSAGSQLIDKARGERTPANTAVTKKIHIFAGSLALSLARLAG